MQLYVELDPNRAGYIESWVKFTPLQTERLSLINPDGCDSLLTIGDGTESNDEDMKIDADAYNGELTKRRVTLHAKL